MTCEGSSQAIPLSPLLARCRRTSANVNAADEMLAAGESLLDAVGDGMVIGRRYVEIRDNRAANPGDDSAFAQLVGLLAASRTEATSAAASVADARRALAAVPDGTIAQIGTFRDAMSARIERYSPMLDTFLDFSEGMPTIFGWNGPRRYLVLTQDPAELRPTGGFIGSYEIIVFDRGSMTEHRFEDVVPLDYPWDYPRIEPPQQLADYLLGAQQPWQFADANWSPDFPTSARDALQLYTNESGDAEIDGVIGITTYTIDEILNVTGPVEVPAYDVTIAPGETTLKALQLTRTASPGEDRKAFLPAFADSLIASVFSLPAQSWDALPGAARALRDGRHLLAWFPDPADQALAARAGVDGAVRQDRGDYLFPVDANVSPASKLNALDVSGAGSRGPDRRVRKCTQHAGDDMVKRRRNRGGSAVPGNGQCRRTHPGHVLPAPRPGAEPHRVRHGRDAGPCNPSSGGRRGGRANGDRGVREGSGRQHDTSVQMDEPVCGRHRGGRRNLQADDAVPARHAARSDPGHHSRSRREPHRGRDSWVGRAGRDCDDGRDLRSRSRDRAAVHAVMHPRDDFAGGDLRKAFNLPCVREPGVAAAGRSHPSGLRDAGAQPQDSYELTKMASLRAKLSRSRVTAFVEIAIRRLARVIALAIFENLGTFLFLLPLSRRSLIAGREGRRPKGDGQWFTAEEAELVNALACIIVPSSDDVPGARDMEVIGEPAMRQIDSLVAGNPARVRRRPRRPASPRRRPGRSLARSPRVARPARQAVDPDALDRLSSPIPILVTHANTRRAARGIRPDGQRARSGPWRRREGGDSGGAEAPATILDARPIPRRGGGLGWPSARVARGCGRSRYPLFQPPGFLPAALPTNT